MANFTPEQVRAVLEQRKAEKKPALSREVLQAELARRRGQPAPANPKTAAKTPQETAAEEGLGSKLVRSFAQTGRNLAKGIAGVGDLVSLPITAPARALGLYDFKPLSEQVTGAIDQATGGYTAPRNKGERYKEAAEDFLGSMVGGGPLAKALQMGAKAGTARKLAGDVMAAGSTPTAANVGAAVGGGLGYQHAQEQLPDSTLASILATMAGTYAGSRVPGVTNLGKQGGLANAAGKALKVNPNRVEALDNIPGGLQLLGDVTDSGPLKLTQSVLEKVPWLGEPITDARNLRNEALRTALGDMSDTALDPMALGNLTKKGAVAYKDRVGTITKDLFSRIDSSLKKAHEKYVPIEQVKEYINKSTPSVKNALNPLMEAYGQKGFIPAEKIKQVIKDAPEYLQKEMEEAVGKGNLHYVAIPKTREYMESLRNQYTTKTGKKTFDASPAGKEFQRLEKTAKEKSGKVPFAEFDQSQALVREALEGEPFIGNLKKGHLSKFQENLKTDLNDYLENFSKQVQDPSLLKNIKRKNKFYSKFKKEGGNADIINEIMDKKTDTEAFYSLLRDNKIEAKQADLVARSLKGGDKETFRQGLVKQLGLNAEKQYSPITAARNWNKLPPESQRIYLKMMPESQRESFQRVMDSMDYVRDSLQHVNFSQTTPAKNVGDLFSKISGSVASLVAGDLMGAATPLATLGAMYGASAGMFSNPAFIRWVDKGMRMRNSPDFIRHIDKLYAMKGVPTYLPNALKLAANDTREKKKPEKKNKKGG